ncbi:MAG: hypothetical protein A2014_03415 [Spirochaetes bacterium GWF1_49_6]|nr:MAG: hypothetical protein A2014_03415 [Spirochaetes bacterium GWF1_49_6]
MTARALLVLVLLALTLSPVTAKEFAAGKKRSDKPEALIGKAGKLLLKCSGIFTVNISGLETAANAKDVVKNIALTDEQLRKAILAESGTLNAIDSGLDNEAWDQLKKESDLLLMSSVTYRKKVEELMEKFKDDTKGIELIDEAYEKMNEWTHGYYQDE